MTAYEIGLSFRNSEKEKKIGDCLCLLVGEKKETLHAHVEEENMEINTILSNGIVPGCVCLC